MKFTSESIDALTYTKEGRSPHIVFDEYLPCFGVRTYPSGIKSYFVRFKYNGQQIWRTFGRVELFTLNEARKIAMWHLHHKDSKKVIAPVKQPSKLLLERLSPKVPPPLIEPILAEPVDAEGLTLRHAWNDYRQYRELKATTLKGYEQRVNKYLSDWLDNPISSITKTDALARHKFITDNHGKAIANSALVVLRLLINYATDRFDGADGKPLLHHNPVKILSTRRCWNRVKPRQSYVQPHQLTSWLQAVVQLRDTTARDYLLFTLLAGLRLSESACLKWENVDMAAKTIRILNTKNHRDHILPLGNYLVKLLISRKLSNERDDIYVFNGKTKGRHIDTHCPSKFEVSRNSGVDFIIHDLRRTFLTVADELDIPKHIMSRLVNHKKGDITDQYLILSIERLRKPMQMIEDEILSRLPNNYLAFNNPELTAVEIYRNVRRLEYDKAITYSHLVV